jgi:serine/threonine protein phosphatase 1
VPQRTIAIGDIHGSLTQFEALLQSIAPTKEDHIILLGDYVDRGPDSAGVLTRILQLQKTHRVTALMGNHEQMMLASRDGYDRLSEWLSVGGKATLASYFGPQVQTLPAHDLKDLVGWIPQAHWGFLETQLMPYLENDDHIFVHACAYADMDMHEQPDYMLRWTNCYEMAPHQSGKTVICGHTSQKSGRPLNGGHFICLDTHAYAGQFLTAMDLNAGRLWQANAQGNVTKSHISDY